MVFGIWPLEIDQQFYISIFSSLHTLSNALQSPSLGENHQMLVDIYSLAP
jgi:hypothetical protein